MGNYPAGYSEPPTMEEVANESIEWSLKFIIDNRVKFRYEGEKNTMLWWVPDTDHMGTELNSLIGLMNTGITKE